MLFLQGNTLTTLPVDVFHNLTKLAILELQDNTMTMLPSGVFRNLIDLETLHLHNNALTTLPAGVFRNLTALRSLLLSHNALATLPADVFHGLTGLRELDLHSNALTTLPAVVFHGLTDLQELDLHGNALTTLPTSVFRHRDLTELQGLDLSENALRTVPADVCRFLYWKAQVAMIQLIDNPGFTNDDSIAMTGEGICDRTPAVKDAILEALMDIHNCALVPDEIEIDDIGDDCRLVTDAHLEAIVTLDLSGKGLTAFEAHDLAGLTSLQELYLQDNALTTLPANLFRDLANL